MTLIVPSFDDAIVVREADAEVLGMAQLSTRLLADSDATGGALSVMRTTMGEGTEGALTRVGFLGRLFPFAPARTTGRLAFAPFHPLSFPLFPLFLLLCRRQRAGGRKVLWPRLRPQGRLRPRLPQPDGSEQTQPSAGDTTQFASPWPFRPAAGRLASHMRRRQLLQLLGWAADLRLAAYPHRPQGTDRQRQPQALRPLRIEHLGVLPAPLPTLVILKPAFDPGA